MSSYYDDDDYDNDYNNSYDEDAPTADDLAQAERWNERSFEIGDAGELIETTPDDVPDRIEIPYDDPIRNQPHVETKPTLVDIIGLGKSSGAFSGLLDQYGNPLDIRTGVAPGVGPAGAPASIVRNMELTNWLRTRGFAPVAGNIGRVGAARSEGVLGTLGKLAIGTGIATGIGGLIQSIIRGASDRTYKDDLSADRKAALADRQLAREEAALTRTEMKEIQLEIARMNSQDKRDLLAMTLGQQELDSQRDYDAKMNAIEATLAKSVQDEAKYKQDRQDDLAKDERNWQTKILEFAATARYNEQKRQDTLAQNAIENQIALMKIYPKTAGVPTTAGGTMAYQPSPSNTRYIEDESSIVDEPSYEPTLANQYKPRQTYAAYQAYTPQIAQTGMPMQCPCCQNAIYVHKDDINKHLANQGKRSYDYGYDSMYSSRKSTDTL